MAGEGVAMGWWARFALTAVTTVASAALSWFVVKAAGGGQATALAVAGITAASVVTLGAVWVARTGTTDPVPASDATSELPGARAVSHAPGPIFGPGSDFSGATISIGSDNSPAPYMQREHEARDRLRQYLPRQDELPLINAPTTSALAPRVHRAIDVPLLAVPGNDAQQGTARDTQGLDRDLPAFVERDKCPDVRSWMRRARRDSVFLLRSFQPELAGQRVWCGRGWRCSCW
jgi:hypothetical protein